MEEKNNMTENEYKMCQTKLKQIRENISDLRSEETSILRAVNEYHYTEHKQRYFFDKENNIYLRTVGVTEDDCETRTHYVGFYCCKDVFDGDVDFYTEYGHLTNEDICNGYLKEITEDTYKQKVREAINKVKEYLL